MDVTAAAAAVAAADSQWEDAQPRSPYFVPMRGQVVATTRQKQSPTLENTFPKTRRAARQWIAAGNYTIDFLTNLLVDYHDTNPDLLQRVNTLIDNCPKQYGIARRRATERLSHMHNHRSEQQRGGGGALVGSSTSSRVHASVARNLDSAFARASVPGEMLNSAPASTNSHNISDSFAGFGDATPPRTSSPIPLPVVVVAAADAVREAPAPAPAPAPGAGEAGARPPRKRPLNVSPIKPSLVAMLQARGEQTHKLPPADASAILYCALHCYTHCTPGSHEQIDGERHVEQAARLVAKFATVADDKCPPATRFLREVCVVFRAHVDCQQGTGAQRTAGWLYRSCYEQFAYLDDSIKPIGEYNTSLRRILNDLRTFLQRNNVI